VVTEDDREWGLVIVPSLSLRQTRPVGYALAAGSSPPAPGSGGSSTQSASTISPACLRIAFSRPGPVHVVLAGLGAHLRPQAGDLAGDLLAK
jgi:hypothetical protein